MGRFSRTRIDKIFLIVISMVPLGFFYAMVHIRWLRRMLVLPIESLYIVCGTWVGNRVYAFLAGDESRDPGEKRSREFEWSSFVPAFLVGLGVVMFLMLLTSYRMAAAFDYELGLSKEDS